MNDAVFEWVRVILIVKIFCHEFLGKDQDIRIKRKANSAGGEGEEGPEPEDLAAGEPAGRGHDQLQRHPRPEHQHPHRDRSPGRRAITVQRHDRQAPEEDCPEQEDDLGSD